MAYRQASIAAGLPFARRGLTAFTALAIAASSAVILIAIPFCASPRGWAMFKSGGGGMAALFLVALVVSATQAALSVSIVRGKHVPAAIAAAAPAAPTITGAVFMKLAVGAGVAAVTGASVDPEVAARILAEGTSEADALVILGCSIGAIAFGAAAVALLASAACVDRERSGAPRGRASLACAVLGVIGVCAALAARVSLRALSPSMLLGVPALVAVTILACMAARNGPLVRSWHDGREANAWMAALLGAAVCAAAAVVLVDVASAFVSESSGLGSIAAQGVDRSQKLRILARVVHDVHAAKLCACVDGLFAFAIVATALASTFARASDGARRSPLGAASFGAIGAAALVAGGLLAARSSAMSSVYGALAAIDAIDQRAKPVCTGCELPRAPEAVTTAHGDVSGTTLVATPDGRVDRVNVSYSRNIVIVADRSAKWASIVQGIRLSLTKATDQADWNAPMGRGRTLSLRVAATPDDSSARLGAYAQLVRSETPTIELGIDARGVEGAEPTLRPREGDDFDAVVAAIVDAHDRAPHAYYRRVRILPPDEETW
jgi:hypothetical protein